MKIQKVLALLSVVVLGTAMVSLAQNSEKTTKLTVKVPTVVGTVTLPPGKYEVKEFNSANQHFVEFLRLSWQDVQVDAGTGMESVSQPQLMETPVAQLDCAVEPLTAPAGHTELVVSDGHTMLKIRGQKLEYVF